MLGSKLRSVGDSRRDQKNREDSVTKIDRRLMLAGAASLPTLNQFGAHAQETKAQLGTPLSVITNPQRDFGPNAPPPASPDPDIIRVDPSFGGLLIGQETIRRAATGYHFLEGPAWSSVGLFAVFSDVK